MPSAVLTSVTAFALVSVMVGAPEANAPPATAIFAAPFETDETMAAEEPATEEAAGRLIDQAGVMLRPSEAGDLFEKKYYDALQRDPDVVLAHAAVSKLFAAGT